MGKYLLNNILRVSSSTPIIIRLSESLAKAIHFFFTMGSAFYFSVIARSVFCDAAIHKTDRRKVVDPFFPYPNHLNPMLSLKMAIVLRLNIRYDL